MNFFYSLTADTAKRPVYRSRSDSTPLQPSSKATGTTEFAQGNINLSKKWRSWSFPQSQYGIPLGTLTAREAAQCFWNTDMLKHRLEKIAECAALEASSLHDDDNELESSPEGKHTILPKDSAKLDDHSASVNDDDLPAVGSTPELIPISEHAIEEDWEDLEQSAIRLNIDDSSCDDDELLAIRSAPSLTQRQAEPCPSTVSSHSAHIL